ncbi:MAG TPA: hypothetical protein PKE16_14170 [Hyphomicrobium sp.]|nr:hypothetical protein [Hyphomicrobium sp.]
MRTALWVTALILAGASPAYAQQRVSPPPQGGTESLIRTPSSGGGSYGTSGNVGAPTSTYPQPVPNYANPAASYGRFGNPTTGTTVVRPNRR